MALLTRNLASARRALTLVAILSAAALLTGCDDDYHHWYADQWAVSVDNRTGITLDIYLDGVYRVSVTAGTLATIPAVVEGRHFLEAYDLQGRLRASRDFSLHSDFVWLLE